MITNSKQNLICLNFIGFVVIWPPLWRWDHVVKRRTFFDPKSELAARSCPVCHRVGGAKPKSPKGHDRCDTHRKHNGRPCAVSFHFIAIKTLQSSRGRREGAFRAVHTLGLGDGGRKRYIGTISFRFGMNLASGSIPRCVAFYPL
jgi:hypothetical protein